MAKKTTTQMMRLGVSHGASRMKKIRQCRDDLFRIEFSPDTSDELRAYAARLGDGFASLQRRQEEKDV